MFQCGDQKKPMAEKVTFPLNTIDFPMRMVIFKATEMDQLVKMAFVSLEAAKDIKSAQVRPKVLSITFGEHRYNGVRFDLDDFSVIVGIKGTFRGKHINEQLFVTKTFSGEILDKCTSDNTSVYVFVQDEANFIDAVKNVYKFLCNLFCEPKETNLVVYGELACMYPIINSIRKITSLNRLSLWGSWGSEEDQKEMFEGILETTTFNSLSIHDQPPVGSKPVKITADSVYFCLQNPSWLSELRLQEVDAKKIILHSSHISTTLAERVNSVLESWHQATGFQRLESITFYNSNSRIGTLKEGLPMTQWDKDRRPGYYCDFEIGEDDEKMFTKFYDIRTAEDLTNQKGELGTIMVGDCVLKFLVWTQKEVENARDAYGYVEKARQMHNEQKIEQERELEGLKGKYHHEDPRVRHAGKKLANTIMVIERCDNFMKTIEECA